MSLEEAHRRLMYWKNMMNIANGELNRLRGQPPTPQNREDLQNFQRMHYEARFNMLEAEEEIEEILEGW